MKSSFDLSEMFGGISYVCLFHGFGQMPRSVVLILVLSPFEDGDHDVTGGL